VATFNYWGQGAILQAMLGAHVQSCLTGEQNAK